MPSKKPARSLAAKLIAELRARELLIASDIQGQWEPTGNIQLIDAERVVRRVVAEHERKAK